ncbi:MAG: DUF2336 domain-containing protein [Rhizobiales bacterium]|nr:DUF2336 domain-containing protein [Hyphomicrobiales bacterium]
MSESSFFAFLKSPDPRERSLAAQVMVRAFEAGELDDFGADELVRGLTLVLDDPDVAVRRALAEGLAMTDYPPTHIVQCLCRDNFDVARPLLENCQALAEFDLVDLVGEGTEAVRRVIAARANLQKSVAAALAEVGEQGPCLILIENDDVDIADVSFVRLTERFGENPEIRAALLARQDIPIDIRHVLLSKLSDALGSLIAVQQWMTPDRARLVLREACEKATIEFTETADDAEQRALVAHLSLSGRLTPGLLMRALSAGNLHLVTESLALLSGLPVKRVNRLLHDRRATTMFALFASAGLPKAIHYGFRLSVRTVIECRKEGFDFSSKSDRLRLIERMLTTYQDFAPEDISYLYGLLTRLGNDAAREDARELIDLEHLEKEFQAA